MQSPKAVLESILSNRFLLFLSFLLPLGVLYYPSWQAGFMSDFLGMFLDVDRLPFADFINRSHAQVKSFYQFTQLQMYLFIRLFGTSFLPWFAITMILHAVNGMLAFRFFRALFQDFGLQRGVFPVVKLMACFEVFGIMFERQVMHHDAARHLCPQRHQSVRRQKKVGLVLTQHVGYA